MSKFVCKHCNGENEVTLPQETAIREEAKKILERLDLIKPAPTIDLKPVSDAIGVLAQRQVELSVKVDKLSIPPVLQSTCEEHPELCQHQAQIDELTAKLQEANDSHDVLTTEYLDAQLDGCPNCKKGLDSWFETQATKRGYNKALAVPPDTIPAKVPVAAGEKMPWEM